MRFPLPPREQWSPEQERVAQEIVSGPRGELRGPFRTLIHSPELASRVQKLGEYLRFESSFTAPLTEIAVLMTARHYDCPNVWQSHGELARKAGVPPTIIAALAARRRPPDMSEDESAIFAFCDELLRHGHVGDAAFDDVAARWGLRGAADLIVLVGYYGMLCRVYNVSQVPLPEGATPFAP